MPKLRMTDTEVQDAHLRQAIKGSAGYFNLRPDEQAEIAGVKRATWYRRLDTPSSFHLDELRKMVKRYHWSENTVCAILGVRKDGSTWDV